MVGKSKYEIESLVSEAVSKFLQEQLGEKVEVISTHFVEDTIIVRLKDFLVPAERYLIKDEKGLKLIKELKIKLMECSKDRLKTLIKDLTGLDAVDIHSNFNTQNSKLVVVFSLSKNLEKAF